MDKHKSRTGRGGGEYNYRKIERQRREEDERGEQTKRRARRHIKISTRYTRRGVMGSAIGARRLNRKGRRRYCVSTVLVGTVSHCTV